MNNLQIQKNPDTTYIQDTIDFSVVIPAFNEETRLPKTLEKLSKWRDSSSLKKIEVIIVDDGSEDNTYAIAKSFKYKKIDVQVIKTKHVGQMHAVISGVKKSTHDFVGILEADSPVEPQEFERLLKYKDSFDIIMGSRQLKSSKYKTTGKSFSRRFVAWCLSKIFIFLFRCKVYDPQIGFKVYKRACFDEIVPLLTSKTDGIKSLEIIVRAYALGYSIKEIATNYMHDDDSKCVPKGKTLYISFYAFWALIGVWISCFVDYRHGREKYSPVRWGGFLRVILKFLPSNQMKRSNNDK